MDAAASRGALRVALVGEEAAGARALAMLGDGRCELVGVATDSDAIAAAAMRLGAPRHPAASVCDPAFASLLADERVDLLLNVHSALNPHPEALAAPRIGAFNLHPGPLPAYAGFNAPSWAIAAGETSYAVTVHRMVEEMDAGPIVFEAGFEIGPEDTGLKVATGCVREGIPLLERLLDAAEAGEVPNASRRARGSSPGSRRPTKGCSTGTSARAASST